MYYLNRGNLKVMLLAVLFFISLAFHSCIAQADDCVDVRCQVCTAQELFCHGLNQKNFDLINNGYGEETTRITFTGNNITVVKDRLFQDSDEENFANSKLSYLNISNNNIRVIFGSKVFQNSPNIKELDLSHNQLEFKSIESFTAFDAISNNLKHLILNNAFYDNGKKFLSFYESIHVDKQLHTVLSKSKLNNLEKLELNDNSLIEFNYPTDDGDHHSRKDLYGPYQDVLCISPHLKHLSLKRNFIEKIHFSAMCLNNKTQFEQLELQSNKISTINTDLTEIFKLIKLKSSNFKVYLENNPFKCDCSLYPFYELIKNDKDIVFDREKLFCTHIDSLHYTLNKRVLASGLDRLCGPARDEKLLDDSNDAYDVLDVSTSSGSTASYTTRNSTATTQSSRTIRIHHNRAKLILFFISCICISLTILAIVRLHFNKCCACWIRRKQIKSYKTLNDERYRNGSNFSINTVENLENQTAFIYAKKDNIPKRMLKSLTKLVGGGKNNQQLVLNNGPTFLSDDGIPYKELDDVNGSRFSDDKAKKNAKKISLTSTILSQTGASSKQERQRFTILDEEENEDNHLEEEETIMDSASIISRPQIVEASVKSNLVIYRTP